MNAPTRAAACIDWGGGQVVGFALPADEGVLHERVLEQIARARWRAKAKHEFGGCEPLECIVEFAQRHRRDRAHDHHRARCHPHGR